MALRSPLNKKNGGIRPIAVGDTIRRLTSRLCCSAIQAFLPEVFLPEGQVGVGIRGGLEAAIHATRLYIQEHELDEDLCLLKVDFTNAFNECDRNTFLQRLHRELPELYIGVILPQHSSTLGTTPSQPQPEYSRGIPWGPCYFLSPCLNSSVLLQPPRRLTYVYGTLMMGP